LHKHKKTISSKRSVFSRPTRSIQYQFSRTKLHRSSSSYSDSIFLLFTYIGQPITAQDCGFIG